MRRINPKTTRMIQVSLLEILSMGSSPNDMVGTNPANVGHQSNNNWNADNENNNSDNSKHQGNNDWSKSNNMQNNGGNSQEKNKDASNNWDKSNEYNENQNKDNDWRILALQQTPNCDHAKENNDSPPEPEPKVDPPTPPEANNSKLREKSKTARSISISQPRSYWYTRPVGDGYTPPVEQNEHHNQPSN